MRRVLTVLLGVVLGALALEAAVRLISYEHEANRTYWGRGAFVADPELGYHHAPDTTAWTGRPGSFGPFAVRTNALGYRDARVAKPGGTSPRLVVLGASLMFGVGVEDDAALFPVRLERALRARPDWPDDLEVYNLSQTGYLARELRLLLERERTRFEPDRVLLVLTPNPAPSRLSGDRQVDVVAGHRLPAVRVGRGSVLDVLRTRSRAFMRIAASPLLRVPFLDAADDDGAPTPDEQRAGQRAVVRHVDAIAAALEKQGIGFAVMIVHRPDDRRRWLQRALAARPFPVFDWRTEPADLIAGDYHWSAAGHERAARWLADQLPPWSP